MWGHTQDQRAAQAQTFFACRDRWPRPEEATVPEREQRRKSSRHSSDSVHPVTCYGVSGMTSFGGDSKMVLVSKVEAFPPILCTESHSKVVGRKKYSLIAASPLSSRVSVACDQRLLTIPGRLYVLLPAGLEDSRRIARGVGGYRTRDKMAQTSTSRESDVHVKLSSRIHTSQISAASFPVLPFVKPPHSQLCAPCSS